MDMGDKSFKVLIPRYKPIYTSVCVCVCVCVFWGHMRVRMCVSVYMYVCVFLLLRICAQLNVLCSFLPSLCAVCYARVWRRCSSSFYTVVTL
jgi:hypothetical protein